MITLPSMLTLNRAAPSLWRSAENMETAELIDPGFAVADGEDIDVQMTDRGLHLRFMNWRENPVHAIFLDAISHRWEPIDFKGLENERYDSSHIIHDSKWLREHLRQGTIVADEGYRHYRLNFNASGTLQVLAKGIELHAEQGAKGNTASRRA